MILTLGMIVLILRFIILGFNILNLGYIILGFIIINLRFIILGFIMLGFIISGLIFEVNIVMLEWYKNLSNVTLWQTLSHCDN